MADTRPTFKWEPLPGATHYRLSLKNLATGKGIFFYDILETEFRPPSPLPQGQYQWYIKATSGNAEATSKGQAVELVEGDKLGEALEAIAAEKRARLREHEAFAGFGKDLTYESNKELKLEEMRRGEVELRSFPLNMILNIGHNCNIDCIMCPSGRTVDNRRIPESFIEDLENYLPFLDNLLISGGEPLAYRRDLEQLVSKAEAFPNVKIGLLTNGQLLDRAWVQRLCSGKFSSISISMDAAREETFNSIRRNASFRKVVDALERIAADKDGSMRVTLNFVVFRRNCSEILDFIDLANKYDVDEVNFQVLRHTMFPELKAENVLYDREASAELLHILDEAHSRCSQYGINIVDKLRPFLFNTYPELITDSRDYAYLPTYASDIGIESNLEERIASLLLQKKPELNSSRTCVSADASQLAKDAFFCRVPFDNLNVDVADSLICCSAMRSFYYIPYGRTWKYLHDIWNCRQLQEARRLLLQGGAAEELCHPVCAFYHKGGYTQKVDKYLWV